MVWKPCDYCKGNGSVTVWNAEKKTYEKITCPACNGARGENV